MPRSVPSVRPGPGYAPSYTAGFDLQSSAAPGGPAAVATISAVARPGACITGAGLAAVMSQLNTYYGGGKAATVLTAAGVFSGPIGLPGSTPTWVQVAEDMVVYTVLAADVHAQLAALASTLSTGGNTLKGTNP